VATVAHMVTDATPLPETEISQYLSGPEEGFDLIYSTFVMHHIEDVQGIVNTLSKKLLGKNGWLVIVDFEGHKEQHDDQIVQHVHEFFKGADGKAIEHVAHKGGFTTEGFADMFRKAGLVDVSAKHAFGLNLTRNDKAIWTDFLVVMGRREA
ncbi:hypothetical protein BGX27_005931, partial [Mortierella sp. AM989]